MKSKEIFEFLTSSGMTKEGAAGVMGNLQHESGLISNRVELLCLKRLRENGKVYTDASYTAAVDSGAISLEEFLHPLPGRQYGYGLAQWTSPGRKEKLYICAKERGKSIGDCLTQLEFLVQELKTSYKVVFDTLSTSHSVDSCSDAVLTRFEMPANPESLKAERRKTARAFYDEFGGEDGMTIPEKALKWMEDTAADARHGYSQTHRWGPDYDCSSAVITAYQTAGVPVKSMGATYTGNMRYVFLRCGFKDVTAQCNLRNGGGMRPGDVLLNDVHHTAMYRGFGEIVHARGQSYGSSATGDQGQEFAVTPYYNYPWNCVLRYEEEGAEPEVSKSSVEVQMPTIRKGTNGSAVKVWQTIIGANPDGDFGPMTESTTLAFQRKVGVSADGIVGPITWKAGLSRLSAV